MKGIDADKLIGMMARIGALEEQVEKLELREELSAFDLIREAANLLKCKDGEVPAKVAELISRTSMPKEAAP